VAPSGHLASWLTPEDNGYDVKLFLREPSKFSYKICLLSRLIEGPPRQRQKSRVRVVSIICEICGLDIEPDTQDVAILDQIIFPF